MLLALLIALFAAAPALRAQDRVPCTDSCCKTDVLLLNTGYNYDNSSVFPTGTFDNFWTVTADPMGGPVPRCARTITPSPVWGAPMQNTQWIASTPSHNNPTNGVYSFEKCFCVCDSGTFQFNIRIRMDDSGTIVVDNTVIGVIPLSPGPSPSIYTFNVPLTLTPGVHCIKVNDVNVFNVSAGFDMDGSVQGKGLVKFTCCGTRCTPNPPIVPPGCDTNKVTLGSDGTWTLVSAPSGGILPRCASVVSPTSPSWGPPIPGSRWIGSRPDGQDTANGVYVYRKCFCTSKRTTLTLNVSAMGDDAVDVVFAGVTIIHYPNWAGTTPKSTTIPISVDSGCHCIDFRVTNESGIETGLDASFTLTGPGLLKPECCACGACNPIMMPAPQQRSGENDGVTPMGVEAGSGNTLLSVPNPTTGETTIYYSLENPANVRLEVYDAAGKLIGTLDQGSRDAGRHAIPYNAHGTASGSYRVQLRVDADKVYSIPLEVQR
jgi:hypothetical protein